MTANRRLNNLLKHQERVQNEDRGLIRTFTGDKDSTEIRNSVDDVDKC
jgi:hypothetical protein